MLIFSDSGCHLVTSLIKLRQEERWFRVWEQNQRQWTESGSLNHKQEQNVCVCVCVCNINILYRSHSSLQPVFQAVLTMTLIWKHMFFAYSASPKCVVFFHLPRVSSFPQLLRLVPLICLHLVCFFEGHRIKLTCFDLTWADVWEWSIHDSWQTSKSGDHRENRSWPVIHRNQSMDCLEVKWGGAHCGLRWKGSVKSSYEIKISLR